MTSDRAALVEAVAQAISNAWDSEQRIFDAAETAIDLIRAEVLEEAARVADDYEGKGMDGGYDCHLGDAFRTRRDIATAIRALKEKP